MLPPQVGLNLAQYNGPVNPKNEFTQKTRTIVSKCKMRANFVFVTGAISYRSFNKFSTCERN